MKKIIFALILMTGTANALTTFVVNSSSSSTPVTIAIAPGTNKAYSFECMITSTNKTSAPIIVTSGGTTVIKTDVSSNGFITPYIFQNPSTNNAIILYNTSGVTEIDYNFELFQSPGNTK